MLLSSQGNSLLKLYLAWKNKLQLFYRGKSTPKRIINVPPWEDIKFYLF